MADGSIPITAGTGTPIRALTNAGVQSGAAQQVFSLAGPDGTLVPTDPDGSLDISLPFTTLLLDSFDSTLSLNWSTGGTAPSSSGGQATFASSTTASAASYMRTLGQFTVRAAAYLRSQFYVRIEAAAITNSSRWWGVGTIQGSPTAAAPVLNGAVFLVDYVAGALQAVTYNNGTKTVVATLTRPTDAATHRYEVWYRQQITYWVLDGVIVATQTLPSYGVFQSPYLIAGSINHTTAPSTAPTLIISSASVADTAGNNKTNSDGLLPWVQQTVKQPGALAASTLALTDSPALVQAVPQTSLNATTLGTAATALTLTLAAPGAGLRHYVTGVWMERYISTATTGAASGYNSTASNSTIVFTLPSDTQAVGVVNFPVAITFLSPVGSTAQNTATTFTVPAITGTVYRISVSYFIAP